MLKIQQESTSVRTAAPATAATPVVPAPVVPQTPNHRLVDIGGIPAPQAVSDLAETGIDLAVLEGLALKLAYSVPRFTTQWASQRLCLPPALTSQLLDRLRADNLVELLGQVGVFNHHVAITDRGREQALRLLEISNYIGPVPVSLADYAASLRWQFDHLPEPTLAGVSTALSELALSSETVEVVGLSLLSRRSLFLYGPPGNGKTTLGHLLHDAVDGSLWIPHCLGVDHNIIRIYDPTVHEPTPLESASNVSRLIDQRWVRVRRPFIVVGGELTLESLDLIFSNNQGFCEAPLHVKANGGTFLLDDFGCQRVSPEQLINRWIHPLERQVDFLTLQTGQQVAIPFRQLLVVSTNLDPQEVMTPAFLRRIGYRVHLDNPDAERYSEIFRRYAAQLGLDVPAELLSKLFARYQTEQRSMRCCEPRDLIERCRDICRLRDRQLELSDEVLDLAWRGYFGA
ncbi:MAG: ATP-binding protein [Planctomycetia bacterium]|nr:ATP-binding protein [Planctomycetia bacterium]